MTKERDKKNSKKRNYDLVTIYSISATVPYLFLSLALHIPDHFAMSLDTCVPRSPPGLTCLSLYSTECRQQRTAEYLDFRSGDLCRLN